MPLVLVENEPDGYLVLKELVILSFFECVVRKMFCYVLCIFLPTLCPCLNLMTCASIPGFSVIT